jgi:hypothetical protein
LLVDGVNLPNPPNLANNYFRNRSIHCGCRANGCRTRPLTRLVGWGVLPNDFPRRLGFSDQPDKSGIQLPNIAPTVAFFDCGIARGEDGVEVRPKMPVSQSVRSRQNQPLD